MFVIFLGAKLAAGYFAPSVPFLEALQPALFWLTIVTGVLMGLFIILELIIKIKGIFNHGNKEDTL